MEKQNITMEQLTALYWLKMLDEFECPEIQTLGEKFDRFLVDPENEEEEKIRETLDTSIDELIEMGYVAETGEVDGVPQLEFTQDGLEIINKIRNEKGLEKLLNQLNKKQPDYNKILHLLYENREFIVSVLSLIVTIAK